VNRTLFIAKMEKNINSAQLRDMVEQFGAVDNVTIIKNHTTNKSKGCGFVKFTERRHAVKAHRGLKNSHKYWVIEWATSMNDPDSLGIDRSNIFLGGLNPAVVTKESIQQRFSPYGKVESISLVNKEADPNDENNEDGVRSAFAFVRYSDALSSAVAIEQQNGTMWNDRRIRVQYCESQEMKNKRRANKYYSNYAAYCNNYYAPPLGLVQYPPTMYPMGYPSPVMYPPAYMAVYNNADGTPEVPAMPATQRREGSPTMQRAENGTNQNVSNGNENGTQQPAGYAPRMSPRGKMSVDTQPYQPQFRHSIYDAHANYRQTEDDSSPLVNSMTALSLDKAPRW